MPIYFTDQLLIQSNLPDVVLRQELAVFFFKKGAFTLDKAADLAQVPQVAPQV